MKKVTLTAVGILAAIGVMMSGCQSTKTVKNEVKDGATVHKSSESPSGYMVTFAYTPTDDSIASVKVTGPFLYIDPDMDLHDKENMFTPHTYEPGMYPTNCAPGPFAWGYTEDMVFDEASGKYTAEFPITTGSFAYSYILTHDDGKVEMIADPANPSPAALNPLSNTPTGDLAHSIVYGEYSAKQGSTPNLDFVRPAAGKKGTLSYVQYKGTLCDDQDLGIYLPVGYNAARKDPYKVIYMSHGGGGNETDWFAMGHLDNIADNLNLDCIIVTMDNSAYGWDFAKIEDNLMNCIIPYMEANYNVSKEAEDRAFGGLSMGSMTTFHMFFDLPEEFGYFGAFSGTDMSAVKNSAGIDKPTFFFTVGTCDIASGNIMPNGEGQQIKYEDMVAYLKDHPMDNVVDGGYVPGSHDWFVWSSSFYSFVTQYCFK